MTPALLPLRSLRFYWRAHLGVLLGAILAAAILVGALAVGDSVKYSLRSMALSRLGETHLALRAGSRFFRAGLASDLEGELGAPVAPLVLLRGTAVADGGDLRVGQVQVAGVDERFWKLGGTQPLLGEGEGVVLNQRLAEKLRLKAGDEVLLRVDKPSLLSRDAPLSTLEDASVALRLPVTAVAGDAQFGRFSLEANQVPPLNAFVPLELLAKQVELAGQANTLLVGTQGVVAPTAEAALTALQMRWRLADAGLELHPVPGGQDVELATSRVFLDPPAGDAAKRCYPQAEGVLTYFVNELRVRERATPYSTVAAMEGGLIPDDLAEDEVVVNQWLADDLAAKPGDRLTLRYFVMGDTRELEERSTDFRIRSVIPLTGAAADPTLMPQFPGLAQAENCRDWKPGIPVDLDRIRDKDEAYWDAHRGTPKAFVTLAAGQRMWNNRFGNLTAVRYPGATARQRELDLCILGALNPATMGLNFHPVREQALAASSQAMDFGQLFLGFSFFLIVAALLLMALLFAFGAEQRAEEAGTLLALGFSPKRVQRMYLLEGGLIALVASVLGAGLGVLYTRAVVSGLSGVWSGAVGGSDLRFHAEPGTLVGGAGASFLIALFAIWLVTRKQAQAPARELMSAGSASEASQMFSAAPTGRLPGLPTALLTLSGGVALIAVALMGRHEQAAGYFFGAGSLLLIGGIALCRALLARMERTSAGSALTVGSLGVRNTVRRRGRSLAAVTLLACGSFLVIAVGASRHDPAEGAERRASGTGGFAFYAESTLPVHGDLNTERGLEPFGLVPDDLPGVRFIPMRLKEGDEASCLNLNRVQAPRVLGVDPAALRERGAFTFSQTLPGTDAKDPWSLLNRTEADDVVPAVGDMNTVVWSLGKGVGDTLQATDERGQPFTIRIAGLVANSILQGGLLISEEQFIRRFPSLGGYQVFLVDAPADGREEAVRTLGRAMEDVGMNMVPAPERLAAFATVENTYLSIFAVLGGLGLLLGSLGLGVIVLRNVLERRGELGLMRAVGFGRPALQWLVFSEHSLLLALGLVVGVLSALVAVLPALGSPGAEVPYGTLALTLGGVLVSGLIWTWGATALALRGPLMSALRNE